jgi:hypothetical protein
MHSERIQSVTVSHSILTTFNTTTFSIRRLIQKLTQENLPAIIRTRTKGPLVPAPVSLSTLAI